MKNLIPLSLISSIILSLTFVEVAYAQQDPQQKAMARAQYMLRQANAENAKLKAELAAAKQESEALKKELDGERKTAKKKQDKLKGTLSAWKESHEEIKQKLVQTMSELSQSNALNKNLDSALNMQTQNFELCFDNNKKLFNVNNELLGRYEEKGAWDVVAQKEPFTQLKRVEIENLIQDYQYQIEDLYLGMNEYLLNKVDN